MKKYLIILIVIVLGILWFLLQLKPEIESVEIAPIEIQELGAIQTPPPAPPTEDYMMSI